MNKTFKARKTLSTQMKRRVMKRKKMSFLLMTKKMKRKMRNSRRKNPKMMRIKVFWGLKVINKVVTIKMNQ